MRICNLLRASGLAGALMITAAFTQRAEGSIIMNISQVGSNVVFTGSGTINLSALTLHANQTFNTHVNPTNGIADVGPTSLGSIDVYELVSGPGSFGSGASTVSSAGSGDLFGVFGNFDEIFVPQGYISGASLSGSSTFDNATLSSLGITPGTYVWTWGSGPTADSFTLTSGTPEPGSMSLLAAGLLLAGLRMRKRSAGLPE